MSQDRCEELNLKGEILNQDNSEPLEEILKRVQFKKINLEGTSLSEEVFVRRTHDDYFFYRIVKCYLICA